MPGRLLLAFLAALPLAAQAPAKFDVASIRPATERIQFERDGRTTISHGTLRMHDVSVSNCISFAYSISTSQIVGAASLTDARYDIAAKVDHDVTEEQMRVMMQSLLTDRFRLSFHRTQKEMRGYVLSVFANQPKDPTKFHPSAHPGEMYRQNSASGTVARNITMKEFADFLTSPLEGPVADDTKLEGQYDLLLDFTRYVDVTAPKEDLPGVAAVLNNALKGELGLQITSRKTMFDVIAVDHVEAPSEN